MGSIDAIIAESAIDTLFQPVVHLGSGTVAGFEALTRGPAGTALESPLALFQAARRAGRLGELDWLCRTQAMRIAADAGLAPSLSWLVNVEPAGLTMDCPPPLLPVLNQARAELRVILEVVERDLQGNVLELIHATDQARHDAWGVALDDVGAEEASLALLPFLRPDVVKLDMSLVTRRPTARSSAITAGVRSYAELTGSVILAEGIENEQQEQLATVLGATYGQGYFYDRPGPLPLSVPTPRHPIPLRQHLPPLDGRTPFEVLAAAGESRRGRKEHLIHISTHLEAQAGQGSHASVLLAGFQHASFFGPAKQARYRRLAAANALTIVLARDLPRLDEPTYHVGPLLAGSRLDGEWLVIVVNPHYAAAFVARDCGDTGPDDQRRFDFVYTHDRLAVINAARCFLQALGPTTADAGSQSRGVKAVEATEVGRAAATPPTVRAVALAPAVTPRPGPSALVGSARSVTGFAAAAQVVLDFLNTYMPLTFWSITRVENDRQSYLYLDDNGYGLSAGDSHPWPDSYCIHMAAGTAPRIAPDASAVSIYAQARVNETAQIGAYAGAPIAEPDGTLFGAICGLDRSARPDLAHFGPVLDVVSELLSLVLSSDRARQDAEFASRTALTLATTDALTGIPNRRAWDDAIARLDRDFTAYADPTVIVFVDLDELKRVNDGPGGHRAGDQLLRSAADSIRLNVRAHDFFARVGGDEFGIILNNCEAALAPTLVRRLSRGLERAAIPASAGWASLHLDSSAHHAVDLADRAMYDAKENRRRARPHAS